MSEPDVASILQRAGDRCGFNRTSWVQKNIPTTIDNITVMAFFGDLRSMFIL